MATREVTTVMNLKAGDQSGPKAYRDAAAAADKAATATAKVDQQMRKSDPSKVDQAARAYKDVASQADKAAASAAKANAAAGQMRTPAGVPQGGPPAQRPAAPAAPQAQGGILNNPANQELLAVAGGIFAATQTVVKGLEMAAKAATAFADDSLTAAQKQRKIVEALDPTGISTNLGLLADALAGKTEAIRKAGVELPQTQAKAALELQSFQTLFPLQQQQATLEARQRARQQTPGLVPFDQAAPGRDTLQGQLDFAAFERKRPLQIEQRERQIDLTAAQAQAANLEKQRADLAKQLADAEEKRKQTQQQQAQAVQEAAATGAGLSPAMQLGLQLGQAGPGGLNNFVGLQLGTTFTASSAADKQKIDAAAAIKKQLAEEQKIREQLKTVTQAQGEAAKGAAEAESRLRQANIALIKDEVQELKERGDRIASQATSFGGLDASERITAAQAAQQFKERGFESLTKDQIQFLNAAGGGAAIAAAQQQSALADPLFKQIMADLGLESDLKQIRQKQVELQAVIETQVEFDTDKLTQDLAKAMKPVIEELQKAFKGAIEAAVVSIQADMDIANASR